MSLSESSRAMLTDLAKRSIEHGSIYNKFLMDDWSTYPRELQSRGASFVTLKIDSRLRGCIGSLEAVNGLAEDVSRNAFSAAFRDPRFSPVTEDEVNHLFIHISVLSPSEALPFTSEKDLFQKIRPGVDGLILEYERHRATFLPSVWDSISGPEDFIRQLKRKAGLTIDFPVEKITISRYTVESW